MNILNLLITLRTRLDENYGHKIKLNEIYTYEKLILKKGSH